MNFPRYFSAESGPSKVREIQNSVNKTCTISEFISNFFSSFRWILRNALFVVCVWFLSTPGHMLMHTKEWLSSLHLWIDDYMPTVLFSIFSILLPLLVTLLNALIPSFYTKSDEARDVMIKKYFLLVMVTVIMPTLGFLDSRQLFQFITHAEENMQFMKLKCFFMADSGAFFIKYLIFSATIGNVQFYFVTILTTSTSSFSKAELARKSVSKIGI